MTAAVLSLVVVGLVISAVVTAILVRVGPRMGMLDSRGAAGHEKILRGVPNIGGIGIVAGFLLPLAAGLLALSVAPGWLVGLAGGIEPFLGHLGSQVRDAWFIVGALLAVHVLGLVDDRRSLPAGAKALVQAALALVLAIACDVRLLTMLDAYPGGWALSVALTVLWLVAATNAINFLDNMDGLAAGVAAIASAIFLAATLVNHQWFIGAALALLTGALLGFLPFNFPPRGGARIFMGDGGSLTIGFALGILTARTTFVDATDPNYALGSAWYGLFMPLLVMAVPLYDLVAVSIMRIRQGKSPFVGDQQHLSHRLVMRGLTPRRSVLAIWALAAILGIGGIALGSLAPWQAALVGVQAVLALFLLGLLERSVPS